MAYATSTLAQGCFGKVYKERYNDTWAAVKKVPQQLIPKTDLERECKVYNEANHPNIVKLLGDITLRDGKWIIPLEFIFGEDLETTIFKSSKSKIQLTPANKNTIIVGMCEGLLHLHSKDIVHQDLKPENIMVEHDTNRAVIIDLGLAKFFRYGLNSAMDMGNEAYSAPEILQRRSQRNQRSDVWAMGKIITELCARVRLYTPSVCPAKIKETIGDQPYCHIVCKMVEPNPSLRATLSQVIDEIRRVGGKGTFTNAPVQKELLKIPLPDTPRNRFPSPINRGASPLHRDVSPMNRAAPAFQRNPVPANQDRSPSPLKFERTPRPNLKPVHPRGQYCPPTPKPAKERSKEQGLVPKGRADISDEMMKMKLYHEAAKDLPCDLPTTGKVVVRRFEHKNGECERWTQTEVVTRDGQIIKFDDIKFDSK